MIISLLSIVAISALLIITGLKKRPGIGILGALPIIAIVLWHRSEDHNALGMSLPSNFGITILLGLVYGSVIHVLSDAFIEPLIEKITKVTPDHSKFNKIKGNWKAFIQLVVINWIFVAIIEEGIYRGFLITEVSKIIGNGIGAIILNVIFSSIVFGISHGYQNRSGMWITGIIGALLGFVFVLSKLNLWVAIIAHGFINTIELTLIAIDKDYIDQF